MTENLWHCTKTSVERTRQYSSVSFAASHLFPHYSRISTSRRSHNALLITELELSTLYHTMLLSIAVFGGRLVYSRNFFPSTFIISLPYVLKRVPHKHVSSCRTCWNNIPRCFPWSLDAPQISVPQHRNANFLVFAVLLHLCSGPQQAAYALSSDGSLPFP